MKKKLKTEVKREAMNYTFLNLAPDEFELLSRDLLQSHLSIHLESFARGKDGGIDFRGFFSEEKKVIVQCKRYSELKDLLSVLKKDEVNKVKKLNPEVYMLTTSVNLTPANKKQVSALFDGLLKEENIYSASDLNNLIALFPDIERKHYKLWLASTNILQSLINNKVQIQSQFEQENFQRISKIYVMNDSFDEAFKILKERKLVVLSGNPGVGKTTLARVLCYDFVKNGYQLILASNSIKEAYDSFSDGTDQVIFFDDFLGRNLLEGRYPLNEEHQLVRFIEKIASSKNKLLILTTREYILNQAKTKYEIIRSAEIDIAKCVVDVSKYTKFIKAKILYNHLYFANLPNEYIEEILKSLIYLKIIEHKNYSPRIIEAIIKKEDWTKVSHSEFSDVLLQYFNKPYSIWETAYSSEISSLSKILLLVILSAGTPIIKEDLRAALENFSTINERNYQFILNDFTFNDSIRELHNTFITTEIDSYGTVAIEFQNPSIQDFLVDYLGLNEGLQIDLINSAIFYNQLFEVFTSVEKAEFDKSGYFSVVRVGLKHKILEALLNKIQSQFKSLRSSKIYRVSYKNNGKFSWHREEFGIYKKLDLIISNHDTNNIFFNFTLTTFKDNMLPVDFVGWEHNSYLTVLKYLNKHLSTDAYEIMRTFLRQVNYALEVRYFKVFGEIFPDQYKSIISGDELFMKTLDVVVKNEYRGADEDNFSDTISSLEDIVNDFGINADSELEDLQKRQSAYEEYVESSIIDSMEQRTFSETTNSNENENEKIFELFSSLK